MKLKHPAMKNVYNMCESSVQTFGSASVLRSSCTVGSIPCDLTEETGEQIEMCSGTDPKSQIKLCCEYFRRDGYSLSKQCSLSAVHVNFDGWGLIKSKTQLWQP